MKDGGERVRESKRRWDQTGSHRKGEDYGIGWEGATWCRARGRTYDLFNRHFILFGSAQSSSVQLNSLWWWGNLAGTGQEKTKQDKTRDVISSSKLLTVSVSGLPTPPMHCCTACTALRRTNKPSPSPLMASMYLVPSALYALINFQRDIILTYRPSILNVPSRLTTTSYFSTRIAQICYLPVLRSTPFLHLILSYRFSYFLLRHLNLLHYYQYSF